MSGGEVAAQLSVKMDVMKVVLLVFGVLVIAAAQQPSGYVLKKCFSFTMIDLITGCAQGWEVEQFLPVIVQNRDII